MNGHDGFDDSQQLDRLVDGEMERDEYRDFLATLEREPDAPGAWDDAARLRESLGDTGAAARALHDAAARADDDTAAERLRHASALLEARDSQAALDMLRTAVARNPGDIRSLATQTRLATEQGELEEYLQGMLDALPVWDATMHFVGNQYIEINGDEGYVESWVVGYHMEADDSPLEHLVLGLRYQDDLVRVGDDWKIIRRVTAKQWHTGTFPRPFIGPPPYPRPGRES